MKNQKVKRNQLENVKEVAMILQRLSTDIHELIKERRSQIDSLLCRFGREASCGRISLLRNLAASAALRNAASKPSGSRMSLLQFR